MVSLQENIKEIVEWATADLGRRAFKYGHIKTWRGYGASWRLLTGIDTIISDPEFLVIYVGNDYEKAMYEYEQGARENNDRRVSSETYASIPDLLLKNRVDGTTGHGPACWMKSQGQEGWMNQRVFPKHVMFVLAIDPYMSAACAVSMALLSRWAIDKARIPGSSARLLTMSDRGPDPAFEAMLQSHNGTKFPPVPRNFSYTPVSNRSQGWKSVVGTDKTTALSTNIKSLDKRDPNQNHMIIWYPSPTGLELVWEESHVRECFTPADFSFNGDRLKALLLLGVTSAIPATKLEGFKYVHIVTSSHGVDLQRCVRDTSTSYRILRCDRTNLCRSERKEQLFWGEWASCSPENVFVYSDCSLNDFISEASPEPREVWATGLEASNFVAMVCNFADWNIMPHAVFRCMFQDITMAELVESRLCLQGVISVEGKDSSLHVYPRLPEPNRHLLRKLLPLLNNDFGLALFVSLPNESHEAMLSKCEVAALLVTGTNSDVLDFGPDLDFDTLHGVCDGSERELAQTGSVWLLLGLFKRIWRETDGFAELHAPDCDGTILDGQVVMKAGRFRQVQRKINQLLKVMKQHGFSIFFSEPDIETKHSQAVCSSLQHDLLRAFLFQLTGIVDYGGVIHCKEICTMMTFDTLSQMAWVATRNAVQRPGTSLEIGIYINAALKDGRRLVPH